MCAARVIGKCSPLAGFPALSLLFSALVLPSPPLPPPPRIFLPLLCVSSLVQLVAPDGWARAWRHPSTIMVCMRYDDLHRLPCRRRRSCRAADVSTGSRWPTAAALSRTSGSTSAGFSPTPPSPSSSRATPPADSPACRSWAFPRSPAPLGPRPTPGNQPEGDRGAHAASLIPVCRAGIHPR